MKGEIRKLEIKSVTATLAIKCYDEQLTNGEEGLKASISLVPTAVFQVLAIKHYKSLKDHWHIIVRVVDREKKFQVLSMLKKLGIEFDEEDDNMINHRALETVGDYTSYATYLLHQTVEAQRNGKETYDISEMVSNLSKEEVQQIVAGYTVKKKALRASDLNACMDRAREAGYRLQDFYEFVDSLNITGLKENDEKHLRNSYMAGVRRLKEENPYIPRMKVLLSYDSKLEKIVLQALKKIYEDKKLLIMNKKISYFINPNTQNIAIDFKIVSQLRDAEFLWSDGISEVTSKIASGTWTGNNLIVLDGHDTGKKGKYHSLATVCEPQYEIQIEEDVGKLTILRKVDDDEIEIAERAELFYLSFKTAFDEIVSTTK